MGGEWWHTKLLHRRCGNRRQHNVKRGGWNTAAHGNANKRHKYQRQEQREPLHGSHAGRQYFNNRPEEFSRLRGCLRYHEGNTKSRAGECHNTHHYANRRRSSADGQRIA